MRSCALSLARRKGSLPSRASFVFCKWSMVLSISSIAVLELAACQVIVLRRLRFELFHRVFEVRDINILVAHLGKLRFVLPRNIARMEIIGMKNCGRWHTSSGSDTPYRQCLRYKARCRARAWCTIPRILQPFFVRSVELLKEVFVLCLVFVSSFSFFISNIMKRFLRQFRGRTRGMQSPFVPSTISLSFSKCASETP